MDDTLRRLVLVPVHHPSHSVAVAQYIRSLGVPILTWLDDLCLTSRGVPGLNPGGAGTGCTRIVMPEIDKVLPVRILHVSEEVHQTTDLTGIFCDTALRRFEVPEKKLKNHEVLLNNALDDGWILPTNLEIWRGSELE